MNIFLAAYETAYGIIGKTPGILPLMAEYNVFLTFWYEQKTTSALIGMKAYGHKGTVVIDSGAHSFFGFTGCSVPSHFAGKKTQKMPAPHLYFERYLAWLDKFRDHFDYFVELDLQEIVGGDTVDKWRERIRQKGLADKMIMVWHSVEDVNQFDDFLKKSESKYVGLEGPRAGKIKLPYNRLIKKCFDAGVRVHGFAFTRGKLLLELPFYSVDSSSWRTPGRYGGIPSFDQGTGKLDNKTGANTEREKQIIFKGLLNPILLSKQRTPEAEGLKYIHAARQFSNFQKHLTKIWNGRGIVWKV